MQTFKDNTGHAWVVEIDFPTIKRVRNLIHIDLGKLWTGEPALIDRLRVEVELVVDTVFAILKPQADKAGVSDEAFAARILGDPFALAEKALWDELADFFQRTNRKAATDLVRKTVELQAAISSRAVEQIAAIDTEKLVALALSTSGQLPTNSQPTPGSDTTTPSAG